MRRISLTLAVLAAVALPAHADPTGEWRVENGRAHIRTALCDGKLWGVVSWEQTPGTDAENPDPSKRKRPTLGLPIILGMTQVKSNRWEGSIYNAQNGKTYQATVTQPRPDVLEVEGCVLAGWVCSGQDWTRVKPPLPPAGSVGSAPPPDLCLRLGFGTGRAQQGGPKKKVAPSR
jgi:uncharacterized protein (DUF2147 family)